MTTQPRVNDRPIVYVSDDGIPTYRASALGSCIRALWAARSGMEAKPPPEHMLKVFAQGNDLESTILDILYDDHNFTFQDGGAQKTATLNLDIELPSGTLEHVRVTGHVDQYGCVEVPSIVLNEDQPHLPIDVKAFAQSTVDNYRSKGLLAFPHYAWQQSVYALGLGHLKFYMPIYNKDTQQIEPWSLEPIVAPYDEQAIIDRITLVESAFLNSTMPDCTLSYPCPFYYLHDDERTTDSIPPAIAPFISARIKLDHKIKLLEGAKKTITDKIIESLPAGSYTDNNHPGYSISHIPNPDRFNTNAAKKVLQDAGVDITDDEFVIKGSGTQLRITPPKSSKKDTGQ